MNFYRKFRIFDPLLDYVPEHPFSYLPVIAQRAQFLLRYRKKEEITLIAKTIDYEIERYFSDINSLEMEKLREQSAPLSGTVIESEPFEEDNPDIPSLENFSEVDTLKAVVGDTYKMKAVRQLVGAINGYAYHAQVPATRPATDCTARLVPYHDAAAVPLEDAYILWQR